MICYLAHPIDAPGDRVTELADMVNYCREELFKVTGLSAYDPQSAWVVNDRPTLDPRLHRVNMMALNCADFCLAILPKWSSSIGVPIEIEYAARYRKQVYVVREGISFSLAGLGQTVHLFDTPEAAIREIRHVWAVDLETAIAPVHPWVRPSWLQRNAEQKTIVVQPIVRMEQPLLTQSYGDDAGFDLYYTGVTQLRVPVGAVVNVPAGIRIQWPDGVWGLIIGRSSSFQRGLLVNISVIDPGFRGEMFALVRNQGNHIAVIEPGERIAQIVPMPLLAPYLVPHLGEVDEGTRGEKGFGSSGL